MGHGKKGGGKKEVLTVGRRGMARLMFTPGASSPRLPPLDTGT